VNHKPEPLGSGFSLGDSGARDHITHIKIEIHAAREHHQRAGGDDVADTSG